MRFHEILDFHEYMEETGKLMNIPKEWCGNNKYAGNRVIYTNKGKNKLAISHLVLNSTQNQIELASISDDLTSIGWVPRKYCKVKEYRIKHPTELEKMLSSKWNTNVTVEITSGCQLHGDKECKIYIEDKLYYEIPWNY